MSASVARRLIVPAPRTNSREILVTAPPFFLGDPGAAIATAPVSPPLLSFDGAGFMDDFLAAAGDRAKLPALLAWRDWAEPPAAMLDAAGGRLYPASLSRALPLAIESEQELPGVLDSDGVPHGDPAWLRKLYLPLHLRFTFVAFDILCQRIGWPRVARARIKSAGAVVRRLVRDPARERWQDWISADGKHGLWFELAGGLPADPAQIPVAAWGGLDAVVRARLGVPATAALPTSLDSAKLSLLPPSVAGAALHTTPYGYVPVFSAAEQVPDEAAGDGAAAIAATLAADTTAQLTLGWAGTANRRPAIRAGLAALLPLTVLPPAPTAPQVATARNELLAATGVTASMIDATLAGVMQTVLTDAATSLRPTAGVLGNTANAATFWTTAQIPAHWSSSDSNVRASFAAHPTDWDVLIRDRVLQAIQSVLVPAGTPAGNVGTVALAHAILALALLRIRSFRLALLVHLHQQMFGNDDTAALTAVSPQTIGGGSYQVPAATAGGLSLEIEAAYGLDSLTSPADAVPTWAPLDRSQPANADAVHRAALALETLFAPIDEAGAAGGSAYETQLATRIRTGVAPGLAGSLGLSGDATAQLRMLGLDLFEQPARGLLVFPGPTPTDAVVTAMIGSVATSYAADLPLAVSESRSRAKVHRLRYDHDSLYAIWGWVRVAGRSDCENDRVVWTTRSEPFAIAEPTDILGAKPATIQLPDLPRLIRDIPRIAKARARPFVAFNTPANSGFNVGDDPKDTSRAWGIGWICSFAIPVITLCAFIMFSFIFAILIVLPGFAWMLLLKFCIPIPVPKKS